MQEKVLITGSSGMLGKEVVRIFSSLNNIEVIGIDNTPSECNRGLFTEHLFDLTELNLLDSLIKSINPSIIIHLAAIVNINICEESPKLAENLHINVSRVLAKQNARLIYISTDSVFNGQTGNYTEESLPDPINQYGKSKYLGELAIRANNPNHLIIRTNIFGFNNPLRKSLTEWALNAYLNGFTIHGFEDVVFNPIYTNHLAMIMSKIYNSKLMGILNIASPESLSKYQFLCYLYEKLNTSTKTIIKSSINNLNLAVQRPLNTVLNIERASNSINLPSSYKGIDQLIEDFQNQKFIK